MTLRDRIADLWFGSLLLRVVVVAALVVAIVLLAGCAEAPAKRVVLTVERKVYVPVPDALTAPCPIEEPQNVSVLEAVRVARARKGALEQCNADKAAIKAIQGTPVPDGEKQ